MNQQILWRMAWKEYRFMRTFWLALAFIALVLQALAAWSDATMPAQGIFVLAAMLTACHALGCGGTAFAGEREAGTYRFLRSLPVTPTSVLWGKLAYAITATILLGVFLWFSGWVYCLIRNFSATSSHYVVLTSGLRTMELLLWAVMFSLLISRPLWSVVLAFVAAGLSGEFLAVLFAGHELDLSESALWQLLRFFLFPAVWWCHLILVIGLLAADIYLVRRWFREAMPIDTEDAARRSPQDATVFALIGRNTAWQRMIWHQVQTSRRMLVAAWVLYAVCVLLAQFISPSPRLANSLIEPLAALAGFYGVLVFSGDQHGREFRFFAEQGVSPRLIWWTREAYWGAILLLSLGALVGLSAILHNFTSQSGGWYRTDYAEGLLVSLGVAVLAYGTGQFCSMSGQRMVLIAAVTAFLTFLSTGWCTAMIAMQVPFIWSVALVPILMFFASWFLVSDWILERSGWRGACGCWPLLLFHWS